MRGEQPDSVRDLISINIDCLDWCQPGRDCGCNDQHGHRQYKSTRSRYCRTRGVSWLANVVLSNWSIRPSASTSVVLGPMSPFPLPCSALSIWRQLDHPLSFRMAWVWLSNRLECTICMNQMIELRLPGMCRGSRDTLHTVEQKLDEFRRL
jgi:hypothetical protein